MKNLLIITTILLFHSILFSQDRCKDILEQGIYDKYSSSNSKLVEKNIYEFLSFSSEKRKEIANNSKHSLFSQGSWTGQYGLFKGLVDYSDSKGSKQLSFESIKKEYEKSGQLSDASFSHVMSQIVNENVVNSWRDCMLRDNKTEFKIETKGSTDGEFIYLINYPIVDAGDIGLIVEVTNVSYNNLEPQPPYNVVSGTKIYPISGMSQRLMRIDKNSPASLVINFTNKLPLTLNLEAMPGIFEIKNDLTSNMPLGTIITSILPFAEFRKIMNENNSWTAQSKWAPADGRQIYGSDLANLANLPITPDLRGQFLRGLNSFSPDETSPVSNSMKDTEGDNRQSGSFQNDESKEHSHLLQISDQYKRSPQIENKRLVASNMGTSGYASVTYGDNSLTLTGDNGNKETRPRNVAVYYYIKINN